MPTSALGAGEAEGAGERLTEPEAATEALAVTEGVGMQAVPPVAQTAATLLATVPMVKVLAGAPAAIASAVAAAEKLEDVMELSAAATALALTPGVDTTALQA